MHKLLWASVAAATIGFAANAQDASTVVATVNGQDITIGHMIVLYDSLPDQYKSLPDEVLFDGIKDQLVQQTVLAQRVASKSNAIKLRLDNEERGLKSAVAIDEAVAERVTEEALQAHYEANFADAQPTKEFNASHILVETEEEALSLIEELNGGADFAQLAQEHSTGPSGPNGGQLGWFGEGMMVPPFEAAVMEMEAETISAPVQTQFGWHVIRLNETRLLDIPPLDEVRADLMEELGQIAIEAAIEEYSAEAEITEPDLGDIDLAIFRDLSLVSD